MQRGNREVLKGNEGKVTKEGRGEGKRQKKNKTDKGKEERGSSERIKEVTTEAGSRDNHEVQHGTKKEIRKWIRRRGR